jgi:23S rRNA (guanosine2251-2'-O)-methyltransferase
MSHRFCCTSERASARRIPTERVGKSRGKPLVVYGVHPVTEIVTQRPEDVERLFVARDAGRGIGRLLKLARQAGIPFTHLTRSLLSKKLGGRKGHQGIAATVAPFRYARIGAVCATAHERSGLLVVVDRVSDEGNLGAILRTCSAAGVEGVILSGEQTAGLSPHVAKASAGAISRIPVAREPRPAKLLERLGSQGFGTVALDPRGTLAWDRTELAGRVAIVAGGEGRGPRAGVVRACARRVAIPMAREMESLNVAVALGVLLFEAVRQRRRSP